MGEGWMEGWEDGGTAICLCVLTHCPPQRPSAQIRRSDTPANYNTRVFACVFVWKAAEKRSRGSTWQDFYGKIILSYYPKSWSGAAADKSAPSPLPCFKLILFASVNCGCRRFLTRRKWQIHTSERDTKLSPNQQQPSAVKGSTYFH